MAALQQQFKPFKKPATTFKPFNGKVVASVLYTEYLTVWEGSVRSAKTVASLLAWIKYITESPETVFLMSGYTLGSLYRNCIQGPFGFLALTGNLAKYQTDNTGAKYIAFAGKVIYCFGGGQSNSMNIIHGLTIGGWYADEIDKHHKDFINEAFSRSVVSTDRRNMWTLNPTNPTHWIYTEYIDRYKEINLPGYRYHHFTLDDNPVITPERKAELERQYSGVFYARYIKGLRVRAEGAIYQAFNESMIIDALPTGRDADNNPLILEEMGIDFGGSGSASAFCLVAYTLGFGRVYILDEMYDRDNLSVEALKSRFERCILQWKNLYKHFYECYADNAEQLIIKSFRNMGLPVGVHNAKKVEINDRIRVVDMLMGQGRFFIMRNCTETIKAIQSAVWDEKKGERLDDGTVNVDSLDAMEYSIERHITDLVRGSARKG